MNLGRITTAMLLGTLTMAALLPIAAHAAPPAAVQTVQATQGTKAAPRRARAWLSVRAAKPEAWVGQAIPITVTAFFRDVEGVTLEGTPTLASKAIVTSEIAKDPRQSTEIIDGERVLVASWAGTVTPSSAGPVDLAVALPVVVRYREAAQRVAPPAPRGDPFSDLGEGDGDPFDAIVKQMQQRMLRTTDAAEGRVHEAALGLKASTPPLDVRALPTANQPATFTGAVGRFDIDATVATTKASVSEPVTLRITVGGDGDLDRVDLPGVASSSTWKAYPPRVVPAPAPSGKTPAKAPKKIFEQVIVPLSGGELTVPEVSFTAFDPTSGTYVTHATKPLTISVDGAAIAPAGIAPPLAVAPSPAPSIAPSAASPDVTTPREPVPLGPVPVVTPLHVLLGVLPVLLLVIAAVIHRLVTRKRRVWALRRSMRRAAAAGQIAPFLGSAHDLIAARLSERWGMATSDVTPARVKERLGPDGGPLVDILVADAALRFGRGGLDGAELGALCKSVEHSLRGAT